MKERGSYLSAVEQERRYEALREAMARARCASAVVVGPAQVGGKRYFRYFTDWNIQSFGGYLLVPKKGDSTAIFRAWSQAYWSRRVGWINDVVSDRDPVRLLIDRLLDLGDLGPVGMIGTDYMSVADHGRLVAALGSRMVDLTQEVDSIMAVKTIEEQELFRQSGAIFDDAWRAVLASARPGMGEWELAAVAGHELLARGVSHSIILIGAGSPKNPAACVGWPRDRHMQTDDVVQMSIEGPGPSGYCVEIGGTFTFGAASADIRSQWAAQLKGMEAGVKLLTGGATSGSIAKAVDDEFTKAGYKTGYPGMHGIGLGIPEPPPIEMGNPRLLDDGNVVAMHPNAVSDLGVGTLTSRTYVVGTPQPACLSAIPLELVEI